jgi:O-antigen/teichoic acid export membrane protein
MWEDRTLHGDLKTKDVAVGLTTPARSAMPAGASRTREEKGERWSALRRLIPGMHALALADQAVVSATSFLTTVMIGRWTDPAQLGAYAIGLSVLVSALAIQESLISLPYSIQRHRPLGTPGERAGSSLAHSGLLAAVIMIVLVMAALGLSAGGARPELLAMSWALAGVMPFALSREFARRFAFAHLKLVQALMLDVAVGGIQLAALSWLGWTGRMSAVTACVALGAACGLSAIGWLYLAQGDFAIRVPQVWATMKQSWSLGKWLFVGQLTVQVQRYITYWLLVVIAGAAVTGVYTACMSVVSFANPLMIGLGNILTPRSVMAWKEGGGPGLRRQAIRDALLLGAVMAAFCAAVLIAGDGVMRFLYHGKDYEGHGHTITVLALAMLVAAVGTPAKRTGQHGAPAGDRRCRCARRGSHRVSRLAADGRVGLARSCLRIPAGKPGRVGGPVDSVLGSGPAGLRSGASHWSAPETHRSAR